MQPLHATRLQALNGWQRLEAVVDAAFGPRLNPLRQLGALGFLLLWLLAGTGIWLYAMLDTSVAGAYPSIEQLSHTSWGVGGLLRSLHRYAADAFVVVMLAHDSRGKDLTVASLSKIIDAYKAAGYGFGTLS